MDDIIPHGLSVGLEEEWPYNTDECEAGSYYSDVIGKTIPCSNTRHQGIPDESAPVVTLQGERFRAYEEEGILESQHGRCVDYLEEDVRDWKLKKTAEYIHDIINVLKRPVGLKLLIAHSNQIRVGIVEEGFLVPLGEVAEHGMGHAVLAVGYVRERNVPDLVKHHPSYISDDYIIIKNSWSTFHGDGGFDYIPISRLTGISEICTYRYDLTSRRYKNCPERNAWGVE